MGEQKIVKTEGDKLNESGDLVVDLLRIVESMDPVLKKVKLLMTEKKRSCSEKNYTINLITNKGVRTLRV